MKIIAIGDNVTDCYLDQGVYYPGGNAVNVAVHCKRNGVEDVNYLGIFGDDDKAEHIQKSLEEEGVTCHHCRKVYAHTAQPGVRIVEGERVFVSGPRGSSQHLFSLQITREDLELIQQYDICHTSCYSHLEHELPKLAEVCKVSMDYSEEWDDEYLKSTCPYLTFAFLSGSGMDENECREILWLVHHFGAEVVGITRGSEGAIFYDGEKYYEQGIHKVDVVDTMGAGDSFIAAFLTAYGSGQSMKAALAYAAKRAAINCQEPGGFGHPHTL